jgi:endoglucanase
MTNPLGYLLALILSGLLSGLSSFAPTPPPTAPQVAIPTQPSLPPTKAIPLRPTTTATPESAPTPAVSVSSGNPLAGGPWGIWTSDEVGDSWHAATGERKALLAKLALQPRVRWFTGGHSPTNKIRVKVRDYVHEQQAGDPDALVQLALFRIFVGGESDRGSALSATEQADYKAWIQEAARGIGSARTVVILEPDAALLAPPMQAGSKRTADPQVRQALVKFAAQQLSALPRTTVYIDAGDADWLTIDKAAALLENSGVSYTRGFALGATHYASVESNADFAERLSAELASRGLRGKHAVLDTADNGRPFTWLYWHAHQRELGNDFDNAAICSAPTDDHCNTLGLPPTWKVTQGTEHVIDAYLWFGRPWLVRQASPYSVTRALQAGRSTPHDQSNITGGRSGR